MFSVESIPLSIKRNATSQSNQRNDVSEITDSRQQTAEHAARISGELPIERSDEFSAVSYRGHAVVLTGADDSSLGCVEALNLRENRWCLLSPLPLLLAACAAAVRRPSPRRCDSVSVSVCVREEEELFVIGGVHRTTGQRSTQIFRLTHSRAHSERGLSLLADDDETMQSLCGVWESCEGLSLAGSLPPRRGLLPRALLGRGRTAHGRVHRHTLCGGPRLRATHAHRDAAHAHSAHEHAARRH